MRIDQGSSYSGREVGTLLTLQRADVVEINRSNDSSEADDRSDDPGVERIDRPVKRAKLLNN